MKTVWLGVDLGGTNCRLGLVDKDGLIETTSFRTQAQHGPENLIKRMTAAMTAMNGGAQELGLELAGAGVACPGVMQRPEGIISFSPNLPGWRDIPLTQRLEDRTGLKVALENDANLYALGEYAFGGHGGRDLACFTLGTGVGGGLIIGGELVIGSLGTGGELGHILVEPGGRECPCGNLGCVEAYASATGLGGMLAAALAVKRATVLSPGDGVKTMAQAAAGGDRLALELFERAGTALGRAFSVTASVTGLDLMVIGGGVARSWPLMEPAARSELEAGMHMVDPALITTVQSGLGDDAPILGAAAFAARKI